MSLADRLRLASYVLQDDADVFRLSNTVGDEELTDDDALTHGEYIEGIAAVEEAARALDTTVAWRWRRKTKTRPYPDHWTYWHERPVVDPDEMEVEALCVIPE